MTTVALKANGTLLHRQLHDVLRNLILQGRYREGDQLPTQEELCAQFSVSRITVRRALAELKNAGLIRNEQGVGSFVTARRVRTARDATLNFLEGLRRVVEETEVTVIKVELQVPPLDISMILQTGADREALHVVRQRGRGDTCLMLLDSWVPARFAQRVSAQSLHLSPLYDLLTAGDETLGQVVQEISAESAEPYAAKALGVEVNAPLLRVTRLVYDSQRQPIQHLVIRATPRRSRMLMQVPGAMLNTFSAGHLVHDLDEGLAPYPAL